MGIRGRETAGPTAVPLPLDPAAGAGAGAGIPRDTSAPPFTDRERRSFAVRLAVFYAALFLVYGIQLPYLPLWLDWRGLSASEIALVTAVPFFVRLAITPGVALYADHHGNHRRVIILLGATAVGAALALSLSSGFWLILVTAVALSLAITTIMPLTEAVTVSGVRSGGLDYGRMRLWGSVTFVIATFVGGALIAKAGAGAGAWMLFAACGATALAALALPAPRLAATAASGTARLPSFGEARVLVRNPVFLVFLIAAGGTQATHAAFYTFGSLHWHNQGLSSVTVGTLWTIGVAAEILLFAWSGWVMQRVWATTLLMIGALAAVARWLAMAFDPPLALLVPLQLLHGATYGATHLGAIHFIGRAVPDGAAGTAQALYATVAAGIAMGLATLLAGQIYGPFGGAAAYLAMTGIAGLGLAATLFVRRAWDGERLSAA